MIDTGRSSLPSPWHQGERHLQEMLGVADRMDASGRKVIRDFMPNQHRTFYQQLPFLVLAAVDEAGAPWATVLEGTPGFITSADPRTLRLGALPDAGDPVRDAVVAGAPVGMLGIEPSTRRRNRVNGSVFTRDDGSFTVTVGHAFGNCPKYIQTREFAFARPPGRPFDGVIKRAGSLDDVAREAIAMADTFFVASYLDVDGDRAQRAVDVSHRGGKPGFIRIDGDVLTVPDFAGNLHFNTLGNLLLNPRAGLVFMDFQSGDLLQLTGATEIVFEGGELASFQGAERLWRFKVEQVVRRRDALGLRWKFGDYSPNTLRTGSWDEESGREMVGLDSGNAAAIFARRERAQPEEREDLAPGLVGKRGER